MNDELKKSLTCTLCGDTKETYREIVYSQGSKVCIDCKKETQLSDNKAFDSDYNNSHKNPWRES